MFNNKDNQKDQLLKKLDKFLRIDPEQTNKKIQIEKDKIQIQLSAVMNEIIDIFNNNEFQNMQDQSNINSESDPDSDLDSGDS